MTATVETTVETSVRYEFRESREPYAGNDWPAYFNYDQKDSFLFGHYSYSYHQWTPIQQYHLQNFMQVADLNENAKGDRQGTRQALIEWMRNRYSILKEDAGSWQIREIFNETTTTVTKTNTSRSVVTTTEVTETIIHTESRTSYVDYLNYVQWEADNREVWEKITVPALDRKMEEMRKHEEAQQQPESVETSEKNFFQRILTRTR